MNFAANRSRRRRITEINLTPLLDIVFNLLIFFLITTTFVQNQGIDVNLPKASDTPVETKNNSVIIALTRDGLMIHENQSVSKDELRERLVEHHKQRSSAMVIIQADEETEHGRVVEIMDLARSVGFAQLAIATEAQ